MHERWFFLFVVPYLVFCFSVSLFVCLFLCFSGCLFVCACLYVCLSVSLHLVLTTAFKDSSSLNLLEIQIQICTSKLVVSLWSTRSKDVWGNIKYYGRSSNHALKCIKIFTNINKYLVYKFPAKIFGRIYILNQFVWYHKGGSFEKEGIISIHKYLFNISLIKLIDIEKYH